ncbi:protein kinase [Streptomyces sp. M41]|uniref:serine/threonine-protein kinase n=1 Tax=Streptomyces sp. M41 TaxID=3059412 RepID=UPI00374DB6BA
MASGENGQTGESGQTGEAGRLLAGRYRVVAQLGRGGMGVVWRAVDEVLGREVAVKELRTYSDADGPELADLRLRMQREARAAARVKHPGVVAVHDVAEVDGRPLIVMELVDGPSLEAVLRERGTLDPREAAGIGAKVMDALAAAHQAGVLHRDVKPGNILLERSGRVVLTDFGIATMDDPGDGSATHLTRTGQLVGSLDYLAPERAQGAEPGPSSDVWALGATLYAAVEGASPFRRTSTFSTLTAIVTEPLPEPRRAGPLMPVLRRLMDKRSESRPEAEEARALLQAVAGSGGTDSATAALRGPAAPAGAGPARDATEVSLPSAPQGPGSPAAEIPNPQGHGPFGPTTGPSGGPYGSPVQGGRAQDGHACHAQGAAGAPGFTTPGQEAPGPPGAPGPTAPAQPATPAQGASRQGFGVAGLPGPTAPGQGGPGEPAAPAYTAAPPFGSGGAPFGSEPGRPDPPAHGFGGPTPPVPDPGATGPLTTPPATPSRRKGRALLAAAAVTVVLAAAGVTVALLNNPGDAGAEARATATAGAPDGARAVSEGPDADRSGDWGLTEKDDEKPSGASEKPRRTAEADPTEGSTKPSPTKTSGGGGTDGGTTGGGSGDGGTTSGGGTTGGGSGAGGGGGTTPAPVCHPIGGGKYNCQVWRTADSYTASGTKVGVLNAGTNYFYCQQNLGRRETSGQWTNVWWARTDDDRGNTNVFVSDVYIQGGDNDEPVPGLPVC